MAIIFGITPSLAPPTASSSNPHGSMHQSQQSSSASGSKSHKSEWGEDDASDKAREKRLRDRLRTWERSDKALLDELPCLSSIGEAGNGDQRPDILVIGGPGVMSALPPMLGPGIVRALGSGHDISQPEKFFRTSILVPSIRSPTMERACRVGRRKEINELTMRMGVGAVGGTLRKRNDAIDGPDAVPQDEGDPVRKDEAVMLEDWGGRIEEWSTVRQIADRAVGSVVAASTLHGPSEKSTLDPTDIPWPAICRAWSAQRLSQDMRKAWTKQTTEVTPHQEEDVPELVAQEQADEVVERVKQDPDLDPHEHRLLPCIIDPGKIMHA
jgi:hypothetical protein